MPVYFGTDTTRYKLCTSAGAVVPHLFEGQYVIEDGKLLWANPNLYLLGDGNSYINTGYIPNGNTTVDLTYERIKEESELFTDSFIFGARTAYAQNALNLFTERSDPRFDYGSKGYVQSESGQWVGLNAGRVYTYIEDNTYCVQYVHPNGTLTGTVFSTPVQEFTPGLEMFIFNANTNGSPASYVSKLKVYTFKIFDEDSNLVRHFVPVPSGLHIGDYVVPSNGMWDIVTQQFYGNQGTGTFSFNQDNFGKE